MKDLNDNTLRQQLIQRYLDGETTVEEEQALARFYQLSDGKFSAEEEAVRQLLLSTNHLADDFTLSEEKEEAFDRMMTATRQKTRHFVLWPWLTAACVALLIFLGFFFYRSHHIEKSDLVAKTDTMKTVPQTEPKQVEERPQRKEVKEVKEEQGDTINKIKEIHKINRPPKKYMAKTIPSPKKADSLKTMEPDNVRRSGASAPLAFADADEPLRGRVAGVNKATPLEELDYEGLKREIQQRGERLNQGFEIAVIDEFE